MNDQEEISALSTRFDDSFESSSEEQLRLAPLLNTINAVEGIVCSGKSTFLKHLQDYAKGIDFHSEVLLENPLKSFLKLFYADMKKYAFSFQLDMLRQRQRCNERSLDLASKGNAVWNDRSMIGDPVFFILHLTKGNISAEEAVTYKEAIRSMGPYHYDRVLRRNG
jgi:deoxyadenosine/deoxycytidine kinase